MQTRRLIAACAVSAGGLLAGCSSAPHPQPVATPVTYPYPTQDVPADQQHRFAYGWWLVHSGSCTAHPQEIPKDKQQFTIEIQNTGDLQLGAVVVYKGRRLPVITSDTRGVVTGWTIPAGSEREIVDVIVDPADCPLLDNPVNPPFSLEVSAP